TTLFRSENLLAEAAPPVLAGPGEFAVCTFRIVIVIESVSAGAKRDDWFSRQVCIDEVFHFGVRPIAKAQEHHNGIRGIQGFRTRQAVAFVWIDRAIGRVDGKKHRALKAVAGGEDFGELRQPLFGTVLCIAGEKHNMISLVWPAPAFVTPIVLR